MVSCRWGGPVYRVHRPRYVGFVREGSRDDVFYADRLCLGGNNIGLDIRVCRLGLLVPGFVRERRRDDVLLWRGLWHAGLRD